MNNKIITQTPQTCLRHIKHLPKSVAFRLVSLKKCKNKLKPHTYTHTLHAEVELPLANPESFVMALRLSVIQSPITWFSLCLCLLVYFSCLLSCTTVILSLVTRVYLCLLPLFFLTSISSNKKKKLLRLMLRHRQGCVSN